MTEEQKSLQWLSAILDILLKKCPWDSVQTIDSLRYLTIEEVYELSEAITAHNADDMRKELGDIFMHLLFYGKLADGQGLFSVSDVLDGICRKLISRHPHIALPDREGVVQPATVDKAPKWEQVKMKEGRRSVLEGVPASLPPLVKAIRLQEKAAGVGFEFSSVADAVGKADEEYSEFVEALNELDAAPQGDSACQAKAHAEEELGDLLFAIIKWGRLKGLNADDALARANSKFQYRFRYVEEAARQSGRTIQQLSLEEMERLWNEAKRVKKEE